MNRSLTRRVLAGAAAGALALGLVACSDDGNDGSIDETVTSSAVTSEADASDSSETASESAAESASESEGAEGETQEIETAGGEKVAVPGALAKAIEEHESDFGQVTDVEEGENGTVATFENGDRIVYSEETGPVELVGKIGETWDEQGGLDAEIGLPTEPEKDASEATGWTQEFQNGTISWIDEGSGFGADIQQN
ncbi:hypothetical protein CFRA_04045 [Corynebacterium frankenforstense DSM 45800]|uniref:LGFP repeat-containing protein n=1 Tax=Corynebacterium frankenforstense DSM 45800 TaxID=1437875 RepID=A0A1L7CRZ5_9CORY|nr:hypothetical protein [Corynebacterium frankenforstense]APT88581.1 hypothetical protein CFRA_04045 [Corynebacterium frankenforstense DSM 45800]